MAGVYALYDLHEVVGKALGWGDATIATMLVGHWPATRASEVTLAGLRARVRASGTALAVLAERPREPVAALSKADPSLSGDLRE